MKVHVATTDLTAFRKRATQRWPREYGELLYGECKGDRSTIREWLKVAHLSSKDHFWYDAEKVESERPSGKYLGSAHSHPSTLEWEASPIPSQPDWDLAIRREELIHAICKVNPPKKRPRTFVQFYLGYPAALEIEER